MPVNSTQVNSTQVNSSKISLSSSVPSEQFLSFHNSLLKPQTPFDINLVVEDLATGQLAEAQITHFDNQGRPNSGTLLIDHDANGLGWFINPTPLLALSLPQVILN